MPKDQIIDQIIHLNLLLNWRLVFLKHYETRDHQQQNRYLHHLKSYQTDGFQSRYEAFHWWKLPQGFQIQGDKSTWIFELYSLPSFAIRRYRNPDLYLSRSKILHPSANRLQSLYFWQELITCHLSSRSRGQTFIWFHSDHFRGLVREIHWV